MRAENTPKIAIIGAGSYVFSGGLLHDLIVQHRLEGSQLVLVDVDEEIAEIMAKIARRMAEDSGVELSIEATGDRVAALQGAHFVTASVAVELTRRWEMDREVLDKYGIREAMSECGGVGGLSYTLRSVPLMLSIARDLERHCPKAWFLNVTNPLPRVMSAIMRHTRLRALGFCNVAHGGVGGYHHVGELIGRKAEELEVLSAGLNHFSWLLSVHDRATGEDLMSRVHAAMEKQDTNTLTYKWWRQYGLLPLAGESHTAEFLPFDPVYGKQYRAHHGTFQERKARREKLREVAKGTRPWQVLLKKRSWERPADVIHALVTGNSWHLDMVNLPNHGNITNLPEGAIVEIPAEITGGRVHGAVVGLLPEPIAPLCAQVSAVHTLAADAAALGDRTKAEEALLIDPAVIDKEAALKALRDLMAVHADLL